MPRRRWLGAGAAVGGKLYVVAGYYEDDPDGGAQGGSHDERL